ncbi:M1 family metallopeptidase [Candidatus Saccharibacteria bacterium]|nr:M1 family metallopeptidase [Candidatus Saccharibacteria bacterium]
MKKSVNQLIDFFAPEHYDLTLDIDRMGRVFRGVVQIRGWRVGEEIRLHAKDLEISRASVNGATVAVEKHPNDEISLQAPCLQDPVLQKEIVIEIEFAGKITDLMHGIYPCYYELNGEKKELLATQFESHHAREVFPCVDEPAAKATFDLTLVTETGVKVLSNMPILQDQVLQERLTTKFATTPKMSTYLLAFVIGDLRKKTAKTKSGVEVNIYATPAQKPESLDFALDTAVRTIDFYDEYFGVKYPLPKSDHVALPDFSSGAMENWGLITYREAALLADKNAGLATKQYIATVITHELSHQWFGNLVTMKWWDDLWLNESFASLCEHIATDVLFPDWQMWLGFETLDVVSALRRDALPGVQSVRQDVNHPDEITTLFDSAIVYAKGERLLKMCRAFIGEDNFRAGLQKYFEKFAYQNTEADDLWQCLSDVSGQDVSGLMTPWLTQPHYPVIHASYDEATREITLTQEVFSMTKDAKNDDTWPIPLFSGDENCPKILTQKTAKFMPKNLNDFQLNVGNHAHFITSFDEILRATTMESLGVLSETDRLKILNEMMLLVRAGYESTTDYLAVLPQIKSEKFWAVQEILALMIADLKKFVENDESAENNLKRMIGDLAGELFQELGIQPQLADSLNVTKLRPIILGEMIYAENQTAIDDCLTEFNENRENLTDIPGDLRATIIAAAVKFGDDETFDYLVNMYKSTQDADLRESLCAGLTATRRPDQIEKLIANLTTDVVRPQDIFYWFTWLLANHHARTKIWAWCRDNWSWIEKTFSGDISFDIFPQSVGNRLQTRAELAEFDEFFTDKKDAALQRAIKVGHIDILARVEWIERDRAKVLARLNQINNK